MYPNKPRIFGSTSVTLPHRNDRPAPKERHPSSKALSAAGRALLARLPLRAIERRVRYLNRKFNEIDDPRGILQLDPWQPYAPGGRQYPIIDPWMAGQHPLDGALEGLSLDARNQTLLQFLAMAVQDGGGLCIPHSDP